MVAIAGQEVVTIPAPEGRRGHLVDEQGYIDGTHGGVAYDDSFSKFRLRGLFRSHLEYTRGRMLMPPVAVFRPIYGDARMKEPTAEGIQTRGAPLWQVWDDKIIHVQFDRYGIRTIHGIRGRRRHVCEQNNQSLRVAQESGGKVNRHNSHSIDSTILKLFQAISISALNAENGKYTMYTRHAA